ncbi:hypothetical protein PVAND_005338 [Polypedilum vanderplanki]|uniref:Transmembrane protein 192 n=1 Tax=Polypedilum vanderplanki TaxID=319348 RepID=A0A9J6C0A1_POLVA|nr:hypothetical protein PVAND_005338 [Polypedilum vanderplanki]
MDDRVPVLSSETSTRVKKLKTVPHFSFHLLVSTAISALGIVLATVWPESKRCEAYFIMLYCRAGFYAFTLLFDWIVRYHHQKLRLNGYHDFTREMKNHHTIPLKIVSLWNTVILAVAAGIHHYYGENFMQKCIKTVFSPVVYITMFNAAETLIFFVVHGTYILKVLKFNSQNFAPDALHGTGATTTGSLGLIHSQSEVNELLEKQSDLIEYLRLHCNRLNQKLQQMSNQLRTVHLASPHPAI